MVQPVWQMRRSPLWGSPQSTLRLPRLLLQLLEHVDILPPGRVGVHACIALTHELGIDQEAPHRDVGQEVTLPIPERYVQLKPDLLALDQLPVDRRRRGAEGRNAEISYYLMSSPEVYLDCRPVNYPEYLRSKRVPGAERDHGQSR
jgi:hypothetical protein